MWGAVPHINYASDWLVTKDKLNQNKEDGSSKFVGQDPC